MEKTYPPQEVEKKWYRFWEEKGYFTPRIDLRKEPYTILLPPPNANDPLHVGHALYVVEDVLCRWHRMMGEPTLFLPGTDHAGIETQYVFEGKLAKKGKSRFDFDRQTLYQLIHDNVEKNRGIAREQLKRLGFSLDWTREKYTLDPQILKTVFGTFRKLHQDGLVYRDERIVNYCVGCGTAFSNLEVEYKEKKGKLWHIKYNLKLKSTSPISKPTFITVATTRPETMLGDTAVAVHPADKRYQDLIGQKVILPLMNREIPIIADGVVDPKFGTGAVKVTPAHDETDFAIGQRHNLEITKVIDFDGKITRNGGPYSGEEVKTARGRILFDLRKLDLLEKEAEHRHSVGVCYRCKTTIEPLLMPQWFIKAEPLAKPAIKVVQGGKIRIVPQRFEKLYLHWMENIRDWNISRQIVWGPRIPAWYCLDCNPNIVVDFIDKGGEKISGRFEELEKRYRFSEVAEGLQQLTAPKEASYSLADGSCKKCGGKNVLQETDTFDTWFSSGQWPLTTLGYPDSSDFKYFYPTAVLDTLWDILFFWVARMVMFGLYLAGDIPFKVAHMHSRVVDSKGQKMSKSRGNAVDPISVVEKYGADVLRFALVFGVAPASDIPLGEEKFVGGRNFLNKLWNIGRFVVSDSRRDDLAKPSAQDLALRSLVNEIIKETNKDLESYRFGQAAERLYHTIWDDFASKYLEDYKKGLVSYSVLLDGFLNLLKLLHPFIPFVTEEIYQRLPNKDAESIMIAPWPSSLPPLSFS